MFLLPICLFTVIVCAIPVALLGAALFQLARGVVWMGKRVRGAEGLPEDWWDEFQEDFRVYASRDAIDARDAERRVR
jgi:hypothetical protein